MIESLEKITGLSEKINYLVKAYGLKDIEKTYDEWSEKCPETIKRNWDKLKAYLTSEVDELCDLTKIIML